MSRSTKTKQRKPLTGTHVARVISDKTDKTRKAAVDYLEKHPKYGKYVRRRMVLHVHDENNEAKNGDYVQVAPCRPISKTKSWRLLRITKAAPQNVGPEAQQLYTPEPAQEAGGEVHADQDQQGGEA